jgi:CubicO group peptidase (beta-lactamase class C family)
MLNPLIGHRHGAAALALIGLVLTLSGCGGGDEATASVDEVHASALGKPQPPPLPTPVVACPTGASFSTSLGFCADATYAYGPFTQAMTSACTSSAGSACTTTVSTTVNGVAVSRQRWSLAQAQSLRGTGACPAGAAVNASVDNLCVETVGTVRSVYSAIATAVVTRCLQLAPAATCYSTRWEADFYLRAAFQNRLQTNLAAAWSGTGVPSVTVAVATPDQGVVYAAVGNAAPSTSPVNPATGQYRWASVSKNFTATMVMRLQEQGYLNIDDLLAQHLVVPGLANGNTMTIRQLLNHTAGVGNYLDSSQSFLSSTSTWRVYTNADIVGYINEVGPSGAPGASYSYSNGNFFILGMLIEQKLGLPIQTAFDQWLAQPLALGNTFLDVTSGPTAKIANLVESSRAYAYSTTSVKADGAVVSTSGDVALYMRAVHGGSFLSTASRTAMQTASTRSTTYGLGTILFTATDGTPYFGHTGTLLNYKSRAYYVPRMDVGVALSMNDYPSSKAQTDIEAAVYNTTKGQYQR